MYESVVIKKVETEVYGWTAVYVGKVREWKVSYLNCTRLLSIYKEDGVTIDHAVECTVDPTSVLSIVQHLDDMDVKNVGWITAEELAKRDCMVLTKLKNAWNKVTGSTADTRNEDVLQIKYIASTVLQEIIEILTK